jgi:hypothetical protein
MSPLEPPVQPAGEEIHLPGPSIHPVLLTGGITASLLGITIFFPVLLIAGLVLTVGVLVAWIRGARRDFDELPAEHGPH